MKKNYESLKDVLREISDFHRLNMEIWMYLIDRVNPYMNEFFCSFVMLFCYLNWKKDLMKLYLTIRGWYFFCFYFSPQNLGKSFRATSAIFKSFMIDREVMKQFRQRKNDTWLKQLKYTWCRDFNDKNLFTILV